MPLDPFLDNCHHPVFQPQTKRGAIARCRPATAPLNSSPSRFPKIKNPVARMPARRGFVEEVANGKSSPYTARPQVCQFARKKIVRGWLINAFLDAVEPRQWPIFRRGMDPRDPGSVRS